MLSDNQNKNLVPRFSLQGTDERKRNTGNDVAISAAHEPGLSVVIQFDSKTCPFISLWCEFGIIN